MDAGRAWDSSVAAAWGGGRRAIVGCGGGGAKVGLDGAPGGIELWLFVVEDFGCCGGSRNSIAKRAVLRDCHHGTQYTPNVAGPTAIHYEGDRFGEEFFEQQRSP